MNFRLVISLLLLSTSLWAQKGTIKGKVTAAATGEELIGAMVYILGTSNGAMVDIDGYYTLQADPGTYKVVCSYISYRTDTATVTVKPGEVTTHNFQLSDNAIAIQTFVKEAKAVKSSENYMLKLKQKSATVMEGVTAQEFSKRGDNTAAAAVKRVTGVTIEGGKYVYVRGLSDRYSLTTLNRSQIPGLDPNRNGVQLDIFPSVMIENMTIVKTFSPDLPGNFTGGLVNIETKDFPDKFSFSFTSSFTYNTQTSFNKNFLTYQGGATDWLGFDDYTRSVPSVAVGEIPALFTDNEKLQRITRAFSKEMAPSTKTPFLNQRYALTIGNTKKLFGKDFGFVFGASYWHKFQHIEEDAETNKWTLTGKVDETDNLTLLRGLKDIKSTENALIGLLGNLSYKLSSNHKIGLNFLFNQNGIKNTAFQEGQIPEDQPELYYQTRALEFTERQLLSTQFRAEHYFEKLKKLKVDWFVSYNKSKQKEPDLRYFNNDYTISPSGDTLYDIQAAIYAVPTRFFRYLDQKTLDGKVYFTMDLFEKGGKTSKLKYGGAYLSKERLFTSRRFNYRTQGNVPFTGDVEAYLADSNMVLPTAGNPSANYIYIEDATEKRNSYKGQQTVIGAYVMGDVWITSKLRAIGGARLETTDYLVQSFDTAQEAGKLQATDLLPALNLAFNASEKSVFRAAYSRTLARPSFREIAPFATYDFALNWVIVGNPSLERTLVSNYDIRYEFYPRIGEIFSIGAFYKDFTNPIERVFNIVAANPEITWRNQKKAIDYGAEFEFKKQLDFLSDSVKHFSVGGNIAYVFSKIDIDAQELELIRSQDPTAASTRPMFGQSPYVVNMFLNYRLDSSKWAFNLAYNVSGPRLQVVVLGATPNIYQQPVHQLNFSAIKTLNKHFKLTLRARNILNPLIKQTQTYKNEEYIFNSYRLGRSFSITLKYSF
tara:strand:+ start:27397 stop:30204 length:2808 start_codon:yes stop_codon:yes gene_type:complete